MSRYKTVSRASLRHNTQMLMRDDAGHHPATYDKMDKFSLAMAYVPWQTFNEVYEIDKALHIGTIFPELDKRFYCSGGGCK